MRVNFQKWNIIPLCGDLHSRFVQNTALFIENKLSRFITPVHKRDIILFIHSTVLFPCAFLVVSYSHYISFQYESAAAIVLCYYHLNLWILLYQFQSLFKISVLKLLINRYESVMLL
jgi:hypothetical protein